MSELDQYGLSGCSEKSFHLMVFLLKQTDERYRVTSVHNLYCSLLQANHRVSYKKVESWLAALKRDGLVSRDNSGERWAWEGNGEPFLDLKKAHALWVKALPCEK